MKLEEICLPIRQDLQEVERVIRDHLTSSVTFVTDVAEYVIGNGGKRLRPMLTLFSSRLAGATGKKAIDCAAAMEFFHTATLMHDDVIDSAEIRRGRASVNTRWGNHVAVLVGDFFYCQASTLLVGTGDLDIIKLVTKAMLDTTEGEILEISRSNDLATSEEDYLRIITHKTAMLMACSCEIGGVLGSISRDYSSSMAGYGLNLGIAFQLADDVLDYVSEKEKFGKALGTDLKEGKMTLPLIVALRHCGNEEKRLIKDGLIAEKPDEVRLREIVSIISKYGGIDYTLKLAKSYVEKAKDCLIPFKPTLEKEALLFLADYAIQRNT